MAKAVNYDIIIEQGATFNQVFTYTGPNGAPVDLTNSSARSQVRRPGTGLLIVEMTSGNGGIVLGGTAGTIALQLSAVQTKALPSGNYLYSVEIISGSTVTRLIGGKCAVHAGVTVIVDPTPDVTAPTVPTGLALTVLGTDHINLDWADSIDPVVAGQLRSGLGGYRIYQDGVLIDSIALISSYSVTGLTENTAYAFQVAAYDLAGNTSLPCAAVSATTDATNPIDTPDVTPPNIPADLALVVKGTTQIDMTWTAAVDPTVLGEVRSGLAGYILYKDGVLLATLGLVTSYSATGLTSGTLYSFMLSAFDAAGNESAQCSPVSATTSAPALNPDTTAPTVPTGLHPAAVVSTTRIDLSWTGSTDPLVSGDTQSGLAGYKVYKDGVFLAFVVTTSYSAVGLSPATSYSFTVSAIDAAGNESAQSSAAVAATNANPDTTAPSVPTNLALGVISQVQIDLTWGASTDPTVVGAITSGLSGYKVYKNGILLATLGNVLTYSATGLSAATSYTFRVSAFDVAGNESAQSTAQSATTTANPDTTAPTVPTALSATAVSISQINLSWTGSTDPTVTGQARSGLAGYKVYKDGVLLATLGLVTTYNATGLTANTLYSFRVSAFDGATNESAQSTAATATTLAVIAADTTAPTVPTGLALAVIGPTQINLSWAASTDPIVGGQTTSGVAGYKVYRNGSLLATLGNVLVYSATGLTPGTSYSFRVSAYDVATNESAQCTAVVAVTSNNPDVTAPTVPGGLAAAVVSATRIDLTWTASVDPTVAGEVRSGLAGYKIYKGGVFLATVGLVTTYSAINLTAGTLYSFKVSAIDVAGNESAQSTAATGTTTSPDTTAPSVPTGLTPTVISSTQINLVWSASTDPTVGGAVTSGVAGYRVYRGGVLIASPTGLTLSVTGLAPSTLYSFTVASIDVAGNLSAQSGAVTATTDAASVSPDTTAPSVPAGLTASAVSSAQVNLSWTASTDPVVGGQLTSGLAGYKIYKGGVFLVTIGQTTSYSATGLTASTLYSFRVSAIDVAGNESAQSTAATATTAAAPPPGTALADWQYRATLPGTIWAHRFTTPNDPSLWFGISPQDKDTNKRAGYIGPLAPSATNLAETGKGYMTVDGVVRAEAGIIGDGCLELYVPAYTDTGGLSYRRPLAPTTGAMTVTGNGITPWVPTSSAAVDLDVNLAGLARYNPQAHISTYPGDIRAKLGGMVGGMFSNPGDLAQYQRAIPATTNNAAGNEITYSGADGFYFQYRTKFKTLPNGKNRLDYAETSTYTTKSITGVATAGLVNKGPINVFALTPGATTLINVGTEHELQAPVVIGGTTYSQFITLANCGAFNGTWRVLSLDPSSANKVTLELNSTGFAAYAGGGTWSTTYNRYELTVGAGHDFWTPITDAGLTYRQRLDVTGGTFAGSYRSDGITATGVIVRIGWVMPAFVGPASLTGYYGPSEGKLWNIYTQPSNSGGLSHQIVNTTRPDPGSAGQNSFFLFGNAGAWLFADKLEQTSNSLIQNQNPSCTYTNTAACFKYPKDEWLTFLIHVIPGQQNLGRQVVPDTTPTGSLAISTITRSGTATVIKVPGLATATKFQSLPYMQIIGTSNWSDPTRTLKPSAIDTVNETLTFPWNTLTMPAYNSGGILRMGALQSWDSWRTTTATKFNEGIEVWVARAGATSYTKLHSVLDYQMYFDTDYGVPSLASRYPPEIAYTPAAPGYNYIELYSYMNPNTGASVPYAFPLWVLYDELICSTQFIPCPGAVATPPTLPPYSTSFPLTENPITESGAWINTSTRYSKVKTTGGNAFGTQTGNGTLGNAFDDSYAYLSGTWSPDQEISAVIYKSGSSGVREVELHLRWAEPGGLPRGYECLLAHDGSYIQLVKWLGTLDSNGDTAFQYLVQVTPTKVPADGDTYLARIVGNVITVYINGVLQYTHDITKAADNTTTIPAYATGSPGIGFFSNVGADLSYGFKSINAANAGATFVYAASLSQVDVAAALAQTSAGKTCVLPAGTANWSTPLNWTAPQNTSIIGGGSLTTVGGGDVSNIVDNYGTNAPLINITVSSTGTFRMAGITVKGGTGVLKDNGLIKFNGPGTIRIDHCHINTKTYSTGNNTKAVWIGDRIYGVMDNCILDLYSTSAVYVYNGGGTDQGNTTWASVTGFGTANFFFIEDCQVIGTPATHDSRVVDGFSAARFVIRHNSFTASCISEKHATGHGPDDRGTRAAEIYNNTCVQAAGQAEPNYTMEDLSSGCALVYNNTANAVFKNQFVFNVTRKNNDTYNQIASTNGGWGYAGTAFNGVGSEWDFSASTASGYPCLDQPGRGKGDLLTGIFPNKVNSRTGTRAYAQQASEPIYIWGNVGTNAAGWGGTYYSNNTSNGAAGFRVVADRDYYAQAAGVQTSPTSPFNGSTGCGWGTLANRPTTGLTTGVGYWATDTNTLYVATGPTTWSTYYQPYTYPHPLRT